MSAETVIITVREAAKRLAKDNAYYEPQIERIYLFPSDEEIRLVEVDSSSMSTGSIEPVYFGADPASNLPFPSAIALITPDDEANRVPPPQGWPGWDAAELLWERNASGGS